MKNILKTVAALAVLGAFAASANAQAATTKHVAKPAARTMQTTRAVKSAHAQSGHTVKKTSASASGTSSKTKPSVPTGKRHVKHRLSKSGHRTRTLAKTAKSRPIPPKSPPSVKPIVTKRATSKAIQPQKAGHSVQRK